MASFITTGSDTGETEYIYGAQLDDGSVLLFDSHNAIEAAQTAAAAAEKAAQAAAEAEEAASQAQAVASALSDDEIAEICV